ncbi:MAG: response regulator [Leptolyngbyaceae cyanobacterium]
MEFPINVLLVEDDEVDVMNMRRALKRKQLSVPLQVARNGLDALTLLQDSAAAAFRRKRQLVLLDLNMPKMGGLEFLGALRQDPDLRCLPVVAMTTSDDPADRRQAYQLNVAGYVLKPVKFAEFADRIETLVRYWSYCEMPK